MHFFHSLIDNKIKEEGFLLLNIRSSEPIDSMPKKNGPALSISGRSDSSVQIRRSPKMNIGYPVAPSQFLVRDTTDQKNVYIMNWKEKLRVTYSKNPFSKRYLQKKVFLQGGLPTGVWSDVEMLESPVYMDPNGSLYNPLAIQVSGYWSYEKVATMLPINYRPR